MKPPGAWGTGREGQRGYWQRTHSAPHPFHATAPSAARQPERLPTMEHISLPLARVTRRLLDLMEDAAEARRRGDLAAAEAAEVAAILALRPSLPAPAGGAVRP